LTEVGPWTYAVAATQATSVMGSGGVRASQEWQRH
jgi:hypothetical protein